MKIITFANQKGGPGKTTCSMLTAMELASQGRSVLMVDSDPQASAYKWETRTLDNTPYPQVPFNVVHLIKLDERQFAAAIRKRAEGIDYVIIDTPPQLDSSELFAALFVADLVVIPFVPDAAHVDALEEVLKLFGRVNSRRRQIGSDDITCRILINRHDKRRPGERAIAEKAEEISGFPAFAASLGNLAAFQNAWNYRTVLKAFAKNTSTASQQISNVTHEIRACVDE